MAPRLELQALLVSLIESGNVYFQPPPTIKMSYPCILYARDNIQIDYADNSPYKHKTRYLVTIIDANPDNETVEKLKMLPMCSYSRFYTADNLNHDVFNLYF